jgi:hypothetical protein
MLHLDIGKESSKQSSSLIFRVCLEFTLIGMLENGILAHSEICCSCEAQLEGSLKSVADGWEIINSPATNCRDAPGIYVKGGLEKKFTSGGQSS